LFPLIGSVHECILHAFAAGDRVAVIPSASESSNSNPVCLCARR
jgi:hypothetical protein